MGYTIQAIVLDGRRGVRQLFFDISVQMCHFHQKQIVTRYLTNNPKSVAGIALKKLTAMLCETNEKEFAAALGMTDGPCFSKRERPTPSRDDGTIPINGYVLHIEA
ncbi:MAG TPA: hypothetical protein DDW17_08150 [Deltaproteobacteria bacterium]|nr:hypothetical protein [Deltaproteobacteria bacterium]